MSAPHTMSLQGRTALITGAASGIGRATALLLAQAGATVVVNHLGRADEAQEVAQQITSHGGKAWTKKRNFSGDLAMASGCVQPSLLQV